MSYQNLMEFNFTIISGENSIIAFKDFKSKSEIIWYSVQKLIFLPNTKNFNSVEYETQTLNNKSHNEEKSESQEVEGFSLIQWNKYSPPPPSDSGTKDFLFFSNDCTDGCTIGSDGIAFFDYSNRKITKVLLSLKVW